MRVIIVARGPLRCNAEAQGAQPRSLPPAATPIVLFFFEVALFLLVMLTIALVEFASREAALALWLGCTVTSTTGYLLVRGSLGGPLPRPLPGAGRGDVSPPRRGEGPGVGSSSLDDKWARTLLHYWRGTNLLLLAGALLGAAWRWLIAT